MKFVGFYDTSGDHFELSNFGGKGHYINRYGDPGDYTEIIYQASKLWYIKNLGIRHILHQDFFNKVRTPKQAFEFTRVPFSILNHHSINDLLYETNWHDIDESSVAAKDIEMSYCLISKFNPFNSPSLYEKLMNLATDNAIFIEESPHDSYWGYAYDVQKRPGKNRLGLLLTALARSMGKFKTSTTNDKIIALIISQYRQLIREFEDYDFIKRA